MNFKEALVAHLQEKNVQAKGLMTDEKWSGFAELVRTVEIGQINDKFGNDYEFRLAPRTILVNGVEVPAPESVAPPKGATYYIPTPDTDELWSERWNQAAEVTTRHIERGLVYLDKESAIARAKAMLITQEVK